MNDLYSLKAQADAAVLRYNFFRDVDVQKEKQLALERMIEIDIEATREWWNATE